MNLKISIIGIAGTNGSGKDSLGKILAEKHQYLFISLTDMLRDELSRQGKTSTRENMRELSAEWRREHGLGVLIDKAYQTYSAQKEHFNGLVMASLRNPGEVDSIHELGGKVVWVDADPHIRFERMAGRGRTDDPKTFEQFMTDEKAEMEHSGDKATLSTLGVKEKADIFLANDTNNLEEFEKSILQNLA